MLRITVKLASSIVVVSRITLPCIGGVCVCGRSSFLRFKQCCPAVSCSMHSPLRIRCQNLPPPKKIDLIKNPTTQAYFEATARGWFFWAVSVILQSPKTSLFLATKTWPQKHGPLFTVEGVKYVFQSAAFVIASFLSSPIDAPSDPTVVSVNSFHQIPT